MKILVVDDEPDILFLIRTILEGAGFEVDEASHGAEALEKVRDSRPDLVVTDLMMPVMDGRQLIDRLKQDPSTAGIPIMLVSTLPEPGLGADVVLEKPFRARELLEAVRSTGGSG